MKKTILTLSMIALISTAVFSQTQIHTNKEEVSISSIDSTNNLGSTIITNVRSYPNPASNVYRVEYTLNVNKPTKFSLVSYTGQNIKSFYGNGENYLNVDTRDLPNGVYYLMMFADGILENKTRFLVSK